MSFVEVEFPLGCLPSDAVESALIELGASSVTFLDRGDEPVLEPSVGEIRLWTDTLVRALFDDGRDTTRLLIGLAAAIKVDLSGLSLRRVEDRVWEREWLKDWKPLRFGKRLWICPTGAANPDDAEAIVVRLDPGLAFGTGTHPTTAQCLETLESLDLRSCSVIDYGCGSGILGIAALKLGAANVVAVDIDPQALLASRENAKRNGVSERLTTLTPPASLPPSDCVFANILAGPLIELAPLLSSVCKAGGNLLLSGILPVQSNSVVDAYRPWFDIVTRTQRDGWCCIHARRCGAA